MLPVLKNVLLELNREFREMCGHVKDSDAYASMVLKYEENYVFTALRRKEDSQFSGVICCLQTPRAYGMTHGPFFGYPIDPILKLAPDINWMGSLNREQRLALRHWQFPNDERGEDTYFRVFCKVQRGMSN